MENQERLTQALADRYRIERVVGSGGMATVYLAEDLKHDRQVAVKVLDPDLAENLGAERFLREIKTAARLTHPHILPLHDSGEAGGFLFYVMPYVKGESLRARLTKEKQLPVEDAIQITREIADALAYAHEEGVIHRDLKPANIMLEAGHAVLADFGVAHAVAEAKDQRITRTGTSLGTPAYMSPEQATCEEDLDGRSDQYALGCVLFEMLAGHPPFTGAQVEAVVRQHLSEQPPSVTRARPAVTEDVVGVINRALSKSPADRFKTTGEMAAALALTTMPVQSVSTGVPLQDRPVWQILVGWAVASLVVFGASGTLRDVVGLPAWVPTVAGLICLGAFPLVLAAALKLHKGLAWRTVTMTIGGAFALLAIGTLGYMGMRVMGIGPFGTLISTGVMEDQARLLVADFSSSSSEGSITAAALSAAIRIDLAQSNVVRIVNLEDLQPTLRMMELPPGAPLTEAVARDAAVREGIPALLVGDLTPIGSAFYLTARLIDPEGGTVFLPLKEEAESEEELIPAANRLVETLRERIGESLGTVNNREPLSFRTTSSLGALKAYTQAYQTLSMEGDSRKAVALLEEALALDSMFASAWRGLGVILNNMGLDRVRQIEALTRAFELSDRLSEYERLRVAASYYGTANIDRRKGVEIYELTVERYPEASGAWNNLANAYRNTGDYEKSLEAARASVGIFVGNITTSTLIGAALRLGDLETAREALDLREMHQLPHGSNLYHAAHIAYIAGDLTEVRRLDLAGIEAAETPGGKASDLRWIGRLDATEGHLSAFRQRNRDADELRLEAGGSEEVFSNRLYLAGFDAIVLGEPDRARNQIEEALRDIDLSGVPPIDRPYLDLSYSLAAAGAPAESREALSEWEAATPDGIRPGYLASESNVRGLIALSENRTEEGLQLLRDAVRSGYGAPAFEGDLAWAYDRVGMPDSALVAYHRYLDAPNHNRRRWDPIFLARAYERLGQLHEERGEVEEAIKYYTLFVDLWAEADPELQPRVEAARMALGRLQAGTSDSLDSG